MKKQCILVACSLVLLAALTACGGNKEKNNATGNTENNTNTGKPENTGNTGTGGTENGGTAGGNTGGTAGGGTAAGGTVDAQAVYKSRCISCHGANLEGAMGGNTNLTKVGARRSKEQITAQITNGGNGMMAFKEILKPEEINALADWLAAKK
ncbi:MULTISPECIES: c-type cytochrome [Paenibacillus]|uniref:c-type cytochrome n=1 Tax=Paenibacillus TaxID=44249 RepID=UPI0022B8C7C6|nr:cytochrome c [Paenibacillus caseinilyticus]MCZ8521822.1 cytochrome c [Paenibacillus caseinilyticus]